MRDEELTLRLGSLRGLRCWSVSNLRYPPYQLYGSYGREWRPGVNLAVCGERRDHRAPSGDCRCGFYAYWSSRRAQRHGSGSLMGIIEGYGKYRLGTLGFRCEKARIAALCPVGENDALLLKIGPAIARHYGAQWYSSRRSMLAAQPVAVPRGTWLRRWVPWLPFPVLTAAIGAADYLWHMPVTAIAFMPFGLMYARWLLARRFG